MSAKDRDRLKVLHEVSRRHITQVQAARELGVSSRWVRVLLQRMKHEGDRGVMHRLRGRPSNRKLPAMLKQGILKRFVEQKRAKQWHDYGPTLAAEELARDYQLVVSKETLRQWLIASQLWKPHRARAERVHSWRARRARYGELVQWDTSEHDWLEGRGEPLYLIAMIGGAKCRGNLLRKHSGNNKTHDLPLPRGQFRVAFSQVRKLGLLLPRFGIALQRLLNRIDQILIPKGLCQKFHRARLHRFDSHGNVAMAGDKNNGDLSSRLV
jgi:hypothetical protein